MVFLYVAQLPDPLIGLYFAEVFLHMPLVEVNQKTRFDVPEPLEQPLGTHDQRQHDNCEQQIDIKLNIKETIGDIQQGGKHGRQPQPDQHQQEATVGHFLHPQIEEGRRLDVIAHNGSEEG